MKLKNFPLKDANMLFFVFALVLFFVGSRVQAWNFEYGMLITEYGFVLAPVVLWGLIRKVDLKKALKINKLSFKHGFIIFWIVLLSLPITMTLNLCVITLLSIFDKVIVMPIPIASNLKEFGVLFFIISITAGICEEVFFRGMILNAYENHYSKKNAIIISAVFFGIFHFNVQNLLGPIFLGVLFAYLVIETNSIFAGILAHAVNNGAAVITATLVKMLSTVTTGDIAQQQQEAMLDDPKMLLVGVLVYAMISMITGVGAYVLLKILKKDIQRIKGAHLISEVEAFEPFIIEDAQLEIESEIEIKMETKKWYKQVYNLPLLGTLILYLYYFVKHMQYNL